MCNFASVFTISQIVLRVLPIGKRRAVIGIFIFSVAQPYSIETNDIPPRFAVHLCRDRFDRLLLLIAQRLIARARRPSSKRTGRH